MSGNIGGNEMREWLTANGHDVRVRGRIPDRLAEHYYREFPDRRPPGSVALLPGPDEFDYDDLGDVTVDDDDAARAPQPDAAPPRGPSRYIAEPEAPEGSQPPPDAPPGHSRKGWARAKGESRARPAAAPSRKPARITVGVKSDINAKVSLVLEVLARSWAARDPLCGGVAVEQRPDIADAFTEIVCGSPDLVAWFTGSGGQFMLWLNLVMACAPVGQVLMAHHVYHTVEEVPADPQEWKRCEEDDCDALNYWPGGATP